MDSIASHPEVLTVIVALPLFGVLAKLFGASFERIAKWYLNISVFAVVIVMNSMFFPFIGGKDYFFRFAVELSIIFFVFAWAFEMRSGELATRFHAIRKKPLAIAVTAFVVAVLLAAIFAYDKHAAFWSNYERGEGVFQMLHYYAFFLLLILLVKTESDWKNVFRSSIGAAVLMILYGMAGNWSLPGYIGTYAGTKPPDGWFHQLVDGRFEGSLGNPAYVAPYLMFSMFFVAFLWIRRQHAAINATVLKIGYAFLIAAFLLFFMLSQTRGAFIGLGAGIFVLLVYFLFAGRGKLRKWSGIVFLLLIILGGFAFAFRNSPTVQQWPGSRLLHISTSDVTAQTRFWVWGEAWKGFLERPILGWGTENFTTVFDKFFNPNFYVPGQNTETWFDRAHSIYFDYLAETGIVGLLAYLSIFAVFFARFFKRKSHETVQHEHGAKHVLERGIVLALPVAYLVQGIAIFDVLPMYINLFLFMGFAYWYLYEHHENHG